MMNDEQVAIADHLEHLLSQRPVGEIDRDESAPVAAAPPKESDTVLDLDRWNMRRGSALAEAWRDEGVADHDDTLVSDGHAALFEPQPHFAELPKDKARAEWFRQLIETPEYQSLHAQTMLDGSLSELGTKNICDQWQQYAAEERERTERGDGDPAEPGSDSEGIDTTLARMRSTQQALAAAKQDVDAAQDMAAGLGMGEPGAPIDRQALARYFKRVQGSDMLRKILAMAGRMRKRCRSLQRQKSHATRGELTGIELGGDVARLVPTELMQVAGAMPELELLALHRLAQRRSLCYKHSRNEPRRQGPIVVCVDESGSMSGDPIVAAKGLAMALAWLAGFQDRWIALVGFAGGTEGTRLALPPKHKRQEDLIEWLLHFYSGGTTLDVPIDELPRNYWPEFEASGLQKGKTDVIIITDAIVSAPDEMVAAYNKWAGAEHVKTYGIVIGGREPGDLAKVCQRCWTLPELNLDTDAVESILSI